MAYTNIKIGLDDKDLQQGLKTAEKSVKELKYNLDNLNNNQSGASKVGRNLQQSAKTAQDAMRTATSAMKGDIGGVMGSLGKLATSTAGKFTIVGAAIMAALKLAKAAYDKLKQSAKDAIDNAAGLNQEARALGMNVNAYRSLQMATMKTGVSMGEMGHVISVLNKLVEGASKGNIEYVKSLADIGLAWTNLQKMSPEKQVLSLTQAMKQFGWTEDNIPYTIKSMLGNKGMLTLSELQKNDFMGNFGSSINNHLIDSAKLQMVLLKMSENSEAFKQLERVNNYLSIMDKMTDLEKKLNDRWNGTIGGQIDYVDSNYRDVFKSNYTEAMNIFSTGEKLKNMKPDDLLNVAKALFNIKQVENAGPIDELNSSGLIAQQKKWNKNLNKYAEVFKKMSLDEQLEEIQKLGRDVDSIQWNSKDGLGGTIQRDEIKKLYSILGLKNSLSTKELKEFSMTNEVAASYLGANEEILDKIGNDLANAKKNLHDQLNIDEMILAIEEQYGGKVKETTRNLLAQMKARKEMLNLDKQQTVLENERQTRNIKLFSDLRGLSSDKAYSDRMNANIQGIYDEKTALDFNKALTRKAYEKYFMQEKGLSQSAAAAEAERAMMNGIGQTEINYKGSSRFVSEELNKLWLQQQKRGVSKANSYFPFLSSLDFDVNKLPERQRQIIEKDFANQVTLGGKNVFSDVNQYNRFVQLAKAYDNYDEFHQSQLNQRKKTFTGFNKFINMSNEDLKKAIGGKGFDEKYFAVWLKDNIGKFSKEKLDIIESAMKGTKLEDSTSYKMLKSFTEGSYDGGTFDEYARLAERFLKYVNNMNERAFATAQKLKQDSKTVDEIMKQRMDDTYNVMAKMLDEQEQALESMFKDVQARRKQLAKGGIYDAETSLFSTQDDIRKWDKMVEADNRLQELKKNSPADYANAKYRFLMNQRNTRYVDLTGQLNEQTYAQNQASNINRLQGRRSWNALENERRRQMYKNAGIEMNVGRPRSAEEAAVIRAIEDKLASDRRSRTVDVRNNLKGGLMDTINSGKYMFNPLEGTIQSRIMNAEAQAQRKLTPREKAAIRADETAKAKINDELNLRALKDDVIYTNSLAQRGGFRSSVKRSGDERRTEKLQKELPRTVDSILNTLYAIYARL